MKVLWHSVGPWVGSGYGQQTATFVPRIKALGHDVAISAYYGLMGAKMDWHGITCYPAYAKQYGTDVIVPHAVHHFGGGEGETLREVASRGLIITLGDVWTLGQPLLANMAVAAWVPVDHETVPPAVADWFTATGAVPIAMSRFGERVLTEIGLAPLYVPHGIDTAVFHPGDKAEARQRVGLPADAFVIALVAANVGRDGARKAFYEQILAFAELRRRHSDAVLALHTDVTSPYGVDIMTLLSDLPEDSYVLSDQYAYKVGLPASKVADIYRAADVLTNCSWGEGFGMAIIEAQACGTPVVVNDTTAMPELVGAGWKVAGEPLWHDSQRAWARKPVIGSIVDAYGQAYEHARDEDVRAQAWAFAQDYDADRVTAEFWEPALKQLDEALQRRREAAPVTGRSVDRPRVVESDGLLWLDRGAGYGDAIGGGGHEADLRPIIEPLLPDGGVLLDVGAHVGHWTLRLAERASRVYAVEANPASASTLRRNLALNDIGNVTVLQVAAWDERTYLRLDDPGRQVAGGSTRTVEGEHVQEAGRHDCVVAKCPGWQDAVPAYELQKIDTLVELDRIDLVKLDVEGADLHALRGMAGLLHKFRPTLVVECHDIYGYYRREDLEALLAELGYDFRVAKSALTHWMPDGVTEEPQRCDWLLCTPTGQAGR